MTAVLDEARSVPQVGSTRSPLFRRLWVGETTSAFGSSVSSVALPLVAITVLHAGTIVIGMLDGLVWLPYVLIGLPAGAWVDRMPRRAVMMVCDVVSLVALISVPLAVWTGTLTLAQLVVVAFAIGTSQVFFTTAYRAFLPAIVDTGDLVEANSRLQAGQAAAQVGGPGAAGLIAQAAGAAGGVLVDAASFAVSLVCLGRLGGHEDPIRRPRRSLRADIAEGLRFVLHDRFVRTQTLYGAFANFVLSGFGAIIVVYLVRGVGLSAGVAGVAMAVAQVGGVAGALLAPRLARKIGSARAVMVSLLAAGPPALLIPLTADGWRVGFFVLGDLALAGGITVNNVLIRGFMQGYVPRPMMGRVGTSTQIVNVGLVPVGATLGGVLAGAIGFRATLWTLIGGLVIASLLLLAGPLRGLRELPTRAD